MADVGGILGGLTVALRDDPAVRAAVPGATVAVPAAGHAPVLAALASVHEHSTLLVVTPTTIDA
ncbi:MAG TPA: hypothetical protein VGZ33_03045, partial [Acidimicrobiales bacterium]|nr:hypothetical protein [Acidimicrobiales bacterium]